VLDRDAQDRYRVQVIPLVNNPPFDLDETYASLELIPSGSTWSPMLGWHSYYGFPHQIGHASCIIIGVQSVLPHSTRGAYLVYRAYVYQISKIQNVAANLESLSKSLLTDNFPQETIEFDEGFVRTKSQTVEEHHIIEYHLIKVAADYYRKKKLLVFRTLVMSASELLLAASLSPCILVTAPIIEKTVSFEHVPVPEKHNMWVSLLQMLRAFLDTVSRLLKLHTP
jgi:hypothetical protein